MRAITGVHMPSGKGYQKGKENWPSGEQSCAAILVLARVRMRQDYTQHLPVPYKKNLQIICVNYVAMIFKQANRHASEYFELRILFLQCRIYNQEDICLFLTNPTGDNEEQGTGSGNDVD